VLLGEAKRQWTGVCEVLARTRIDWVRASGRPARRVIKATASGHATALLLPPKSELAPIRVGDYWIVAGGRRALPSAFDPIGPSGALVQTRVSSGADRAVGAAVAACAFARSTRCGVAADRSAAVQIGRVA